MNIQGPLRWVWLAAMCAWALPGMASGECIGRIYHMSGTVVNDKGKPLSTTITFSWQEEHDGRTVQKTSAAQKGRYNVDIPFYTQAKSIPGMPVPGGGLYACTATLKTLHYSYPSGPNKQVSGDIAVTGDTTSANLPVAGTVATPR